jgi:arylsulfatase A-like enzyme
MRRAFVCLLAMAAPARAEPVFDLVDNRMLAHVERGGGIVALAGSPGFAKYLNFGKPNVPFKLGQSLDGKRVAIADMYTRVVLPLAGDQIPAKKLYLRLHSPKARDVEVELNGVKVGKADIRDGWQTVTVALPDAAARAGENDLKLVFGKKGDNVAVEWIQLGGSAPPDDAPRAFDAKERSIGLARGVAVSWYVQIPKQGRLVGQASCPVAVRARGQDGQLLDGELKGAGSVDLAAVAGKVVKLTLTGTCDDARVKGAALATPGPTPSVSRAKRPRNVVFWIMDSLRADKVRPFVAGARPEVPNWEKLAREATIFTSFYVQGNESKASHASLWSSLYPVNHGVFQAKDKLDGKWTTVGEAMKAMGLYTSGVSSNGWIIEKWGFGDGWDAFRNHIHQDGGTRGEDVWRAAVASLKDRAQKPFFLYLGMVDTHVTWRAHEPWIGKYDTAPYSGPFVKAATDPQVDNIVAGKLKITDRDKTRIMALYDSDVSYQDDLIAKVRDQLKAWGIADDTMVVITADHGDEFWEDGRLGHGGSVRETLVHVPTAIYYPPLFPAGTVVEEGAESVDLLPTMVDALGGEPAPEWQGESLIALAQGMGRGYPRPAFVSQYEDAHAMRLGGWKIIAKKSGALKLYHVVKDPLEKEDLVDSRPYERRFVTDAMSTFLLYQKDWKKRRWGVASNQSRFFGDDLER